jgi:uncharacterized membrane protein
MSGVKLQRQHKFVLAVMLVPSAAAVFLLGVRILLTSTFDYSFMLWNLTLSLMAVAAAFLCAHFWGKGHMLWKIVFFITWLFLLPNTFYMLTDYIHLGETVDINLLFDICMLALFAMAGFIQGCVAIYLIHRPLIRRTGLLNAHLLVGLTLLASSFAVDMGRFLRWNSWDILLQPQALLFDISDTLLNPLNYNRSFLVTGVFFVASGSAYLAFWYGMKLLRADKVE